MKTNQEAQNSSGENRSSLASAGGIGAATDSTLSSQPTESTSSVENLMSTPTKRKRMSTASNLSGGSFPASKRSGAGTSSGAVQPSKAPSETSHGFILCNHMENNYHLSNKKAIYYNMKTYYELTGQEWWRTLPLTFHIKEGINDKEFAKFQDVFKGSEAAISQYGPMDKLGKHVWIVKPGENTNRGCGIQVCRDIQAIRDIVNNTMVNGKKRSYIIQKYIEKPLLFKGRKFDIRCFTLLTSVNGNLCGYWYNEGYLRTSSKEFQLKNVTNRLIHLTNDAV